MRGVDVLLEVLASEGVTHVFGNPGTTELPFVDALAGRDEPHFVLALQEASAVAMADGYAQVTGRPAFLNLHTSAGLGNGIGNLTNARANAAPLVVTAGNADRRHLVADPMLSGDLVTLAGGVTKWGHEVRAPHELGTVLRRAFHDAAAAPVYGSPLHGRRVFPPTHPLWAGMLAPEASRIRTTLEPYWRVLLVGWQAFMVYPYSPGSPLPDGTDLLHLSPSPHWLGRAHP